MPLEGEKLVIEPSYPFAEALNSFKIGEEEPEEEKTTYFKDRKARSIFHCTRRRFTVVTLDKPNGKVEYGLVPDRVHHLSIDLRTMGCSEAWGIEQERKALDLLATLIPHVQMKHYLLTGTFLERSKRSGLYYFFRRLKPTAVLSTHKGEVRALCTLCLHPIAHYADSWAGAMCPTDDVLAHLMLMRGDEAMLWRRANQHAPWTAEAGL